MELCNFTIVGAVKQFVAPQCSRGFLNLLDLNKSPMGDSDRVSYRTLTVQYLIKLRLELNRM